MAGVEKLYMEVPMTMWSAAWSSGMSWLESGGGVGSGNPGEVDEGEGGFGEVPGDDLAVGVVFLPGLDEFGGEGAGDGVVAAWAGFDDEQVGHERPRIDV
jgi:hypothetical protein